VAAALAALSVASPLTAVFAVLVTGVAIFNPEATLLILLMNSPSIWKKPSLHRPVRRWLEDYPVPALTRLPCRNRGKRCYHRPPSSLSWT
jgi:hypothetical protein